MENEWIPVTDRYPDEPEKQYQTREYIVTLPGDDEATSLTYIGNGQWQDLDYYTYNNVIAWMPMPKKYQLPSKKYRWRLSCDGMGSLGSVYLRADGLVLTLTQWDYVIDNANSKNVFTNEEFNYFVKYWKFNPDIFTAEEVPE